MNAISIEKSINKYFLILVFISSLFIPILLGLAKYELAILLVLLPFFIYTCIVFGDQYRFIFIFTSFLGYYIWVNARVQPVSIISYMLIIYYIFNYSSKDFNGFKLPILLKIIVTLLIVSVFTSAIKTPFISKWSIYYSFMFFVYIFTGYIIFKSVTSLKIIDDHLNYFYKSLAFFAIFIIIQIFFTGNIRSYGISGPTIPDMITMGLLIIVFKSYISSNFSKINIVYLVILLMVLITTLSRFAWFGFVSTAAFGLILNLVIQKKKLISKKTIYLILTGAFLLFLLYVSGLYKLILLRILEVDFNILDTTKEEGAVSNSLDTRVLVWVTALNAFMQNKLTGVGYFMFHKVSENYNIFPDALFVDFVMGLDPHSTFLGFLTETGIFGFTSFFCYLLATFVLSLRAIKYSKSENSKTNSIILSILIFFIFSTSFYSGAFTFGFNAYVLHAIVGLTLANYVLNKKIFKNNDIS